MGIGFLNLLTLVFIGLKVANLVDWSWWLVMAPSLISAAIGLLILSCIIIVAALKS